jgi:hypothetical protein
MLSDHDVERIAQAVYERGVSAARSVPALEEHELEAVRQVVRDELRRVFIASTIESTSGKPPRPKRPPPTPRAVP